MPVKKGDKVSVEYTGTLDNGEVFDSSEGREPLVFTIGSGEIIPAFEEALMDMNEGDEKEFRISAENAYGAHDPALVEEIPRDNLPEGDIAPGVMLTAQLENGTEIPATIVEVGDDTVKIDFNHPLAGESLNFHIKLLKIEKTEE
jgi:FKBP-type peptidyl-prolyl cis-trans isomerase 2